MSEWNGMDGVDRRESRPKKRAVAQKFRNTYIRIVTKDVLALEKYLLKGYLRV
jgi:hypothetical protein